MSEGVVEEVLRQCLKQDNQFSLIHTVRSVLVSRTTRFDRYHAARMIMAHLLLNVVMIYTM